MKTTFRLNVLLAVALVVFSVEALADRSVPIEVRRTARQGATLIGPIDDQAISRLGMVLRMDDLAGLRSLVEQQQDPGSPNYHRWVTPEEFGDRFGRSRLEYERVIGWLRDHGFAVTSSANRLFVDATGDPPQPLPSHAGSVQSRSGRS